jgi:hypothetical protein
MGVDRGTEENVLKPSIDGMRITVIMSRSNRQWAGFVGRTVKERISIRRYRCQGISLLFISVALSCRFAYQRRRLMCNVIVSDARRTCYLLAADEFGEHRPRTAISIDRPCLVTCYYFPYFNLIFQINVMLQL